MAIVLNTVKEALEFLDSFDGYGMMATDEELQVEELRNRDLIDDYKDYEKGDEIYKCTACNCLFSYDGFGEVIELTHYKPTNEVVKDAVCDECRDLGTSAH